jgi:hypothetical protein
LFVSALHGADFLWSMTDLKPAGSAGQCLAESKQTDKDVPILSLRGVKQTAEGFVPVLSAAGTAMRIDHLDQNNAIIRFRCEAIELVAALDCPRRRSGGPGTSFYLLGSLNSAEAAISAAMKRVAASWEKSAAAATPPRSAPTGVGRAVRKTVRRKVK